MNVDEIIGELGKTVKMCGVVFSRVGEADEEDSESFVLALPTQTLPEKTTNRYLAPDQWAQVFNQLDSMPVEAWVQYGNEKPALTIIRKCERQISTNVSWQVYRRDDYSCRYCGNNQIPLTVDHLVTWEAGGPSTVENLVASCRKCNNARGNLAYDEWLKTPFYKKRSKGLTDLQKFANIALVSEIKNIKVSPIKKKRR